jgi:hypothetical protein
MRVAKLIRELQQFSDLSDVVIRGADGEPYRVDSVQETWFDDYGWSVVLVAGD